MRRACRPKLADLSSERGPDDVRMTVVLDFEGERVQGSAKRPAGAELECAAAATSLAITLGTEILVRVSGCSVVNVGDHRVCLTVVHIPALGGHIAGSVLFTDTATASRVAARSVLHATNRVISDPELAARLAGRIDAIER